MKCRVEAPGTEANPRSGRNIPWWSTPLETEVITEAMAEEVFDHHWISMKGLAMVRNPFAVDTPQLQDVLDALDDPDCQTIIKHVEEPMTASELAETCEIPLSTMYRKLELLSDASLLEERIEIRMDGRHTTRYDLGFEEVRVGLDEDRSIEVAIKRREQTPDRRLSELWSEVRKEI